MILGVVASKSRRAMETGLPAALATAVGGALEVNHRQMHLQRLGGGEPARVGAHGTEQRLGGTSLSQCRRWHRSSSSRSSSSVRVGREGNSVWECKTGLSIAVDQRGYRLEEIVQRE